MIAPEAGLSVTRQCALLGIARSSFYYRPRPQPEQEFDLLKYRGPELSRVSRPKISDNFNVPSGDSAVQAESRVDDFHPRRRLFVRRKAGDFFIEPPPAGRDHHRAAPADMAERPALVPSAIRPGGRG